MADDTDTQNLTGPAGGKTSGDPSDATPMVFDDGTTPPEPSFIVTDKDADGLTPEAKKVLEERVKHFQADYTRKTEDLAKRTRASEESLARNKELADQLEAATRQFKETGNRQAPENPELAAVTERFEAEDLNAIRTLIRAEITGVKDELNKTLNPILAQTVRADAQSSVDAFLAKPENEHLRGYRDDVVQWYRDRGMSPGDWPLENLFRHLDYPRLVKQVEEARKTGRLDAIQGIAKARERSVGSEGPPQPIRIRPAKTLEEAWEMSEELVRQARQGGG